MVKYARREALTDTEMRILEEIKDRSSEHREMVEQFGDPEWVRAPLAELKPAPMRRMWTEINAYLDTIGAPDDRCEKGWRDHWNLVPLRSWWPRVLRRFWRWLTFQRTAI